MLFKNTLYTLQSSPNPNHNDFYSLLLIRVSVASTAFGECFRQLNSKRVPFSLWRHRNEKLAIAKDGVSKNFDWLMPIADTASHGRAMHFWYLDGIIVLNFVFSTIYLRSKQQKHLMYLTFGWYFTNFNESSCHSCAFTNDADSRQSFTVGPTSRKGS